MNHSSGRTQPQREKATGLHQGFSLIELLIVVALISLIASFAVPNLLQSKKAGNEASAIASVRQVTTAQLTYASTVGSGSFTTASGLVSAGFIDNSLGSGMKDGYSFLVVPNGSNGFYVTAVPIEPGVTGERSFYSDYTGVIRYALNGSTPDASSPPLEGLDGGRAVIEE